MIMIDDEYYYYNQKAGKAWLVHIINWFDYFHCGQNTSTEGVFNHAPMSDDVYDVEWLKDFLSLIIL